MNRTPHLLLAISLSTAALADELPPGAVIAAGDLDAALSATFDGHELADTIPESMQFMIRNYALKINLKKIETLPIDASYYQVTQRNAGTVELDPETKLLKNYVAGTPFPNIDAADPLAGYKVIWNSFYYHALSGAAADGDYDQLLIDADKGLDQHQTWHFTNLPMVGRTPEPHRFGDGLIAKKEMVYAKAPYDAKGFATLTYRYNDGRLDDSWGYIKSVRRVRRFSSGSWMDPVGGSDLLYDDINGFNANPAWYGNFRYLGRRHILGFQLEKPQTVAGAASKAEEFPHVDLKNWPHWNPIQEWGPVATDVIEATPPEQHPYSKKIYYLSADYPGFARYMEAYDKAGKLWKVVFYAPGAAEDAAGRSWITRYAAYVIDVQREHATVAFGWNVTPTEMSPDEIDVNALARVAR